MKHLKKAGGHIGWNVAKTTIKMKTIVRKTWMIKIIKLSLRNSDNYNLSFHDFSLLHFLLLGYHSTDLLHNLLSLNILASAMSDQRIPLFNFFIFCHIFSYYTHSFLGAILPIFCTICYPLAMCQLHFYFGKINFFF